MKRLIILVSLVGAAVSGFLWWKRREVSRAEAVAQDPWPSVVAESPAPTKAPTPAPAPAPQPVTPAASEQPASSEQAEAKVAAKKTTKKATKKVEADPHQ
jgi:cytoskeletal protein RodZ